MALVVLVAAIYAPAWHGGMVWDDDAHVTSPDLRSVSGLWRIWFEFGATQQYYPVVHSAFWLMARLWGDDTLGYHLVNILLHATSAFLVMRILDRVAIPGALLAGVLFAVHPVGVESVAWITELKNTLSGTLYLAAAFIYLRFDASRSRRAYAAAFVLFVFALLAKSVTATLPFALLVLFWERRGVLTWRRDLKPLMPFVVVGVASGLLTAWVERTYIGAVGSEFSLSLIERCLVAGRAVWFYLGTLAWPSNLTFIYPRWNVSAGVWWQYLYPLTLLALLVVLWIRRHWTRAPLAALLFFGITLGPALGFVNVFPFKYSYVADHFQYLASLGILTLVAATSVVLLQRRWPTTFVQAPLIVALGLPLAILTWHQSHQFADAATLYRTTIARNPGAWLPHNDLAMIALRSKPPDLEEALRGFEKALALAPNEALVRFNVGTTLYQMGRVEEALPYHREAVRLAPNYAEAWGNLGTDLQHLGHNQEAVDAYRRALELKPTLPTIRGNLGIALQSLNRLAESTVVLREAVSAGNGTEREHAALAAVLLVQGHLEEAVAEYQQALRLAPDGRASAELHNDLGVALARLGRISEAVVQFRHAIRLDPEFAPARDNLAKALPHNP